MSNGTDNFPVMPPYHSKEERDRMTTNTTSTAIQAPAEIDIEFINLMSAYRHAESAEEHQKARRALVDYHDAKLAQARQEGYCEGSTVGFKGGEYFYKERATAAEAKLERLETEVQALIDDGDFFMGDIQLHALDGIGWVECVSAILQPQPKADESGLPG